jgi:hypothetical protein
MDIINERGNFYCVITADILYRKDLSPRQKILIAMISNLSNVKGYCWASNSHFAEALDCDERTIRREIGILEEKVGLGRIMNLDKDGKEYFRVLILPDGLNKINGAGQDSPGDRTRTSGGDRTRTSANKQSIKTKNNTLSTIEKEEPILFNSPEKSSAIYQLETKSNWENILSKWITEESISVLNAVYKKYFVKLDMDKQLEIVQFINSLGQDTKLLNKIWISPFLKNDSDLDALKKEIDRKKLFNNKPSNTNIATQEDLKKSSNGAIDMNKYF